MRGNNHHQEALSLGQTAIVIAIAAWPVIQAASKRVIRRRVKK